MLHTSPTVFFRLICALCLLLTVPVLHAADWLVELPASNSTNPSGRLLLLLEPFNGTDKARLAANAVYPGNMSVASQDITALAAGSTITLDTSTRVFKADFAELPAGDYLAQVWLDRDYSYSQDQGGARDLHSAVRRVRLPLAQDVRLTLDNELPAYELWDFANARAEETARREAIRPRLHEVEIVSELLSAFHRQETRMRAWVLLPTDYDDEAARTWPVAYLSGTFSATHKGNIDLAAILDSFGITNEPSMIWVFLDFASPQGPTLFADSAQNGPWGTALVEEFIPQLESRYRMDARASGRLLTGHSSGGWTSIYLLTHFPETFGGAWATAPDPVDFTRFLQTDLYAADANLYVDAQGQPKGLARSRGNVVTTIADSVQMENVLGTRGGIFQSWEWAFSPPGATAGAGAPAPLFDRVNGNIDPAVARYWREHFDLAFYIRENWTRLAPLLNGKLHVIVGTQDDHYLEESVYALRDTMAALDADAYFEFIQDKTHNNLFSAGDDPVALFRRIANEMYATAR